MIRLLIGAALGYAAYRIARETLSSIPDDFEPMPEGQREPQRGAVEARAATPGPYSSRP